MSSHESDAHTGFKIIRGSYCPHPSYLCTEPYKVLLNISKFGLTARLKLAATLSCSSPLIYSHLS